MPKVAQLYKLVCRCRSWYRNWKLDVGCSKKSEFQASMTSIDTSIDNLKQKLHFRDSKL
ncbi:MAG: hypothetical protein ABIL62_09635 [Planctomycetota bacterium]